MTRRTESPPLRPVPSPDHPDRSGRWRFAAREAVAYARQGLPGRLPTVEVDGAHGPTVVLVHGHLSSSGCFDPLRRALADRGHRRFLAFDYGPRGTVRGQAGALADFVERHAPFGPLVVVGHSLGGLVARYWIQSLGAHARTRALVTLSTPHQGVPLGRLAERVPLIREVRRDGPLMRALAEGRPRLEGLAVTSIVSSRDHLLRDPAVARLEGAEWVVLDEVGHAGVLYAEAVHRLVGDRLAAANATRPPIRGRVTALGRARP